MEVLKPELVWVGERCYRKNPSHNDYGIRRSVNNGGQGFESSTRSFGSNTRIGEDKRNTRNASAVKCDRVNSSTHAPYVESDLYEDERCDADAPDEMLERAEFNIEKLDGGFKSKCENIPSDLFSVIIGMKGATKKRIEAETNTKIIVPRMNEPGFIVVRGQRYQDVVCARTRIDMLTSQARFRRDPTHFACFPLNFPNIVEKFREFKHKVLNEFKGPGGIDETIFQEPEKIHLTLCTIVLLEQSERQRAERILEEMKVELRDLISKTKFGFRLQGLEIMNDDPSEVNVLYGKCNFDDASVQKIADLIAKKFVDSALGMPLKGGSVKIHATLMNSRYRQEASGPGPEETVAPRQGSAAARGKQKQRNGFDARQILKKFGDFDFGTGEIQEIHISTRFTSSADNFYRNLAKITF